MECFYSGVSGAVECGSKGWVFLSPIAELSSRRGRRQKEVDERKRERGEKRKRGDKSSPEVCIPYRPKSEITGRKRH